MQIRKPDTNRDDTIRGDTNRDDTNRDDDDTDAMFDEFKPFEVKDQRSRH